MRGDPPLVQLQQPDVRDTGHNYRLYILHPSQVSSVKTSLQWKQAEKLRQVRGSVQLHEQLVINDHY